MGMDKYKHEMTTASIDTETVAMCGQAWSYSKKQQKLEEATPSASCHASSRHHGTQRALRKSCSEAIPLRSSKEVAAISGSSNVLDVEDKKTENNIKFMEENDEERRQRITVRAEEILREKRYVGMLEGATCPVCLMDDVDTQLSGCGHLIHAKCIKRWVQSGTCCPVCREEVVDVEEAFTSPAALAMTKDRLTLSSEAGTYLPEDEEGIQTEDDTSYEWGWFEDFDEGDTGSENGFMANKNDIYSYSTRRSLPTFPASASMQSLTTSTVRKQGSSNTFNLYRTFPPLREMYDTPYHQSKYSWMRALPSHRHIAANIQIRSFRIVEAKSSKEQHAEYLIEMQLDGYYYSRWRRFSEIHRFVRSLNRNQFRQSMVVWQPIEANSRWFNRLELTYLHKRCRLLEEFVHMLLIECTNAHPLADLMEC